VETPQGRKSSFANGLRKAKQKGNVLLLHGLFADSQSFTTLGRKIAARGYRTTSRSTCPAMARRFRTLHQ
jgi:hypothetical protein